MNKARILFLATHPKEVASTRCRVLAYEPALRRAGYEPRFHSFFPSGSLEALYAPGEWWPKTQWFLKGVRERWEILRRERYDLLFIHRELFPLGLSGGMHLLERELRRCGCPVIYDFDDAVFLPHRQNRGLVARLENPGSVRRLIARSERVIAGNAFLAEYAQRLNPRVDRIPTPVDTARYVPFRGELRNPQPTIGWIGSPSTAKYLLSLAPALERLARAHRFRLKVIGAGQPVRIPGVDADCRAWDLLTEAEEFRSCDIGVYPLWEDEWSKGKCGYKALQFMASGIPVVASAVGMNLEILQHRVNSLLARTPEEWIRLLSELLQDASLRRTLGQAGRATVEQKYSLVCLTPQFLSVIESALERSVAGDRHPQDGAPALSPAGH